MVQLFLTNLNLLIPLPKWYPFLGYLRKHISNFLHVLNLQFVELSKAQDAEAGDGTTSVVVIAGSLLTQAQSLLEKGYHPTLISEAFGQAAKKAEEIMKEMSIPVELTDRDSLLKSAITSLNSKVPTKRRSFFVASSQQNSSCRLCLKMLIC